jgi:hypothetical protein
MEVLWHEIVHGIFSAGKFEALHNDEVVVQHVGAAIVQILKDLGWIPKEYLQ